mmetsp:Transcript_30352/g.72180  ORF Transcript_30352/g.72180 Transcript_30352/m.72180 type:complete len:453 (-) Transcript_30352:2031-3389(-)
MSTSPRPASSRTVFEVPPRCMLLPRATSRARGSPRHAYSIIKACCILRPREMSEDLASGAVDVSEAASFDSQGVRRGSRLHTMYRSPIAQKSTDPGSVAGSVADRSSESFADITPVSEGAQAWDPTWRPATTSAAVHCSSLSDLASMAVVSGPQTAATTAGPTARASPANVSMLFSENESERGVAEVRGKEMRSAHAAWTAADASGMPAAAPDLLPSARSSPDSRWSWLTLSMTPWTHSGLASASCAAAAAAAAAGPLPRAEAPRGARAHPLQTGSKKGPGKSRSRGASNDAGVRSPPPGASLISVSSEVVSTSISSEGPSGTSAQMKSAGSTARHIWRIGRMSELRPRRKSAAVSWSTLLSRRTIIERAAPDSTAMRQCTFPPDGSSPSRMFALSAPAISASAASDPAARAASARPPASNCAAMAAAGRAAAMSGSDSRVGARASPVRGGA